MRVVIRSAAVAVLFLVALGCGSTSPDEPETGENLPPLSISTESLASGHVGAPYQQPLAASGGVKPYGWSLGSRSAELAWLRVDPISGALSGNPSKAVSAAPVSVVVTDQHGVTTSRDFAITIEACKAGDTLRCHVGSAEGCQVGTLA